MRTILLYFISILCCPALTFSQKLHPVATSDAILVNTDPKDHVRAISQRMTDAWDNGQPKEVINIVDQEVPGCSTQPDSTFCKAAIWYTGGYLFQNGFEQGDSLALNYKSIAESYYKRILEVLPDNQDALSNLLALYEHGDSTLKMIKVLDDLAKAYPRQRINYLLRIGDLYLRQFDPGKASNYYEQAYVEDPWSEAACSRLVNLYALHGIPPNIPGKKTTPNSVNEFIYNCQDIGLPNFSEEMARRRIAYNIKNPSVTKDQLIGSLLIWIDILAQNNWLEERRVEDLRIPFFEKNTSSNEILKTGNKALTELVALTMIEDASQIRKDGFWYSDYTQIRLPDREPVSSRSVFIKVLHAIGVKAYFNGESSKAEQFWQLGFRTANFENVLFTVLGKELAQLYTNDPKLDPGGQKMERLVGLLFHGKMDSYLASNNEMIREYHTVLGSIYYDQKKYSGGQYTNAEFQLYHALEPKLGPIINPELRMMLVDVYGHNKDSFNMMNENIRAIMDMLRLDRMEEADKMIDDAEKNARGNLKSFNTRLGALSRIRKFRSACADPSSPKPFENQKMVYQFIHEIQDKEAQAITQLDQAFVREQNFKALADLGQYVPENHPEWQQQIYSQALQRIENNKELGSIDDYHRLQRIRQSLSGSLDDPQILATERLNKEVNINYKANNQGIEFRSFVIPSLDREIQIPQAMFQLNKTVTEYYKQEASKFQSSGDTVELKVMSPKIHLQDKTYKVIKNPESLQQINEPIYQKNLPYQQQMQKKPIPEKEILQMKPKVH